MRAWVTVGAKQKKQKSVCVYTKDETRAHLGNGGGRLERSCARAVVPRQKHHLGRGRAAAQLPLCRAVRCGHSYRDALLSTAARGATVSRYLCYYLLSATVLRLRCQPLDINLCCG